MYHSLWYCILHYVISFLIMHYILYYCVMNPTNKSMIRYGVIFKMFSVITALNWFSWRIVNHEPDFFTQFTNVWNKIPNSCPLFHIATSSWLGKKSFWYETGLMRASLLETGTSDANVVRPIPRAVFVSLCRLVLA